MAASEDELGALHTKVAQTLAEMLDGQTIGKDEEGEPIVMPPSAAVLTASIQFLKNNNVTAIPSKDNALGALEEKMRERQRKRDERLQLGKADLSQATEQMGFLTGDKSFN